MDSSNLLEMNIADNIEVVIILIIVLIIVIKKEDIGNTSKNKKE